MGRSACLASTACCRGRPGSCACVDIDAAAVDDSRRDPAGGRPGRSGLLRRRRPRPGRCRVRACRPLWAARATMPRSATPRCSTRSRSRARRPRSGTACSPSTSRASTCASAQRSRSYALTEAARSSTWPRWNGFWIEPSLAAYSAAKGGVIALTRSVALDDGPRGNSAATRSAPATSIPAWRSGTSTSRTIPPRRASRRASCTRSAASAVPRRSPRWRHSLSGRRLVLHRPDLHRRRRPQRRARAGDVVTGNASQRALVRAPRHGSGFIHRASIRSEGFSERRLRGPSGRRDLQYLVGACQLQSALPGACRGRQAGCPWSRRAAARVPHDLVG